MEENNTVTDLLNERVALAKERNLLAGERTRLSAERTLSAWMRTGLASVGGGFAIIRLLEFQNVTHRVMANAVGEVLIIWGIIIFILALIDYRESCKKVEHTNKRNQGWITITILIFIMVSLFLFYVTLS